MTFKQLTEDQEITRAFTLYPDDWKEVLIPVWPDYAKTAQVYALEEMDHLATLGILFHKGAPEMDVFADTASRLFKEGKPYIGFLYTLPDFRGRGYASLWLKELKKALPDNTFWLTVEDPDLISFYENNGFTLTKVSSSQQEWLLLTTPGKH